MRAELDALRREVAELQEANDKAWEMLKVLNEQLALFNKVLEPIARDWGLLKGHGDELLARIRSTQEWLERSMKDGEDWKDGGR